MAIPKVDENVKALLNDLDRYLAKAYTAYVHGAWAEVLTKPRLTLEEVSELQSKIRLITGG